MGTGRWHTAVKRWGSNEVTDTRPRRNDHSTVEDLSKDEVFHVLQASRRRDALRYLRDADEPVRLRDLAEHVAAWEHDVSVAELTSTQRQRVYISLYQTHLPKLDEKGIVEYDKERGVLEATDRAAGFYPYLDGTATDGDPWARRYVGAGALCGVGLLVLSIVDLSVPEVAVGGLVISVFLGLAAVHAVAGGG